MEQQKIKGFKLVKAKSLSSTTIDKLWQSYIDGSSVKAQVPTVLVEDFSYTGNWKGERINLQWKTELTDGKKSYSILLNLNQKTPIILQLQTANHRNYLMITKPYSGHFEITRYDNALKGFYYDADGKKYKIKWMKQE